MKQRDSQLKRPLKTQLKVKHLKVLRKLKSLLSKKKHPKIFSTMPLVKARKNLKRKRKSAQSKARS